MESGRGDKSKKQVYQLRRQPESNSRSTGLLTEGVEARKGINFTAGQEEDRRLLPKTWSACMHIAVLLS